MAKQYQNTESTTPPGPPDAGDRQQRGFTEAQKRELKEIIVEALRELIRDEKGEDFKERVREAIVDMGGPPLG